ncbi:sulfatase [Compostibacter hankyongensis]|uniref:Sulfatase n=1 Tax=Compostibacter hankyongensis TaxID=1007089 RepID=A0ABP8G1S0_9BACT
MKNGFFPGFLFGALALLVFSGHKASAQKKPNILFIVADDLRPTLNCYGDSFAITPNINRIAERGTVFRNAYCQEAVCNPSRASFMTGLRPNTTRVWDLKTHFRKALPEVITLPEWFKQHGYHAQSVGKIYHDPAAMQDRISWSSPETMAVTTVLGKYVLDANLHKKGSWKATATERADAPEIKYIDGMVSHAAVQILDSIKDKPFFLAVGFRRPHLPFSAPEKYWAMYDHVRLPAPANPRPPSDVPAVALKNGVELNGYTDIPDTGAISEKEIQTLIRGYYACTTFMDAQVGKLLDELDRLGLRDNTIIVFLGDNGYHLGEQDLWCKATDFENGAHIPLIIASPWQQQKGTVSTALVELVDVYPTLVELAGMKAPPNLEGSSVKPLLNDPGMSWKKAAFSQFPRPWPYKKAPALMGYSVRTKDFRYTEWQDFKTGEIRATELYDHRTDDPETKNVAHDAAYQNKIKEMHQLLKEGWKKHKP